MILYFYLTTFNMQRYIIQAMIFRNSNKYYPHPFHTHTNTHMYSIENNIYYHMSRYCFQNTHDTIFSSTTISECIWEINLSTYINATMQHLKDFAIILHIASRCFINILICINLPYIFYVSVFM